jgi:hypothetical protein
VSLTGPRRGWEVGREARDYRCRSCGHTVEDFFMPDGWLQIRVRDPQAGPGEHTYRIVGLYCSAGCLAEDAAGWAAAVQPAEAEAEAGGSG